MPKVEIVNLGAKHDRKDIGEVGETVEVSEAVAVAMVRYGYAKPAEDEADENDEKPAEDSDDETPKGDDDETGENPADKREKATSDKAAKRETRSSN